MGYERSKYQRESFGTERERDTVHAHTVLVGVSLSSTKDRERVIWPGIYSRENRPHQVVQTSRDFQK